MKRIERELRKYREARCCKNCIRSEIKVFGTGTIGYMCVLDGGRCNKISVCDNHKFEFEAMEALTITFDIGHDDDNDTIEWVNVAENCQPLDERTKKILLRAIEKWQWEETHKED